MTMNPSEYEIQREVEALRDIKRRSVAPGTLIIDPDLPGQSSQNPYWPPSTSSTENDSSSSSSHDDASSSSSHTDATSHKDDDPLHLFWVPASVHPEIAPAEFRAFLKEHSRSPPPADGSPTPSRSNSLSVGSSLGRKRSMLSRQYSPSENDGVGEQEEKIVPLRRNRSSIYHNQGPQLTINDLQRLEQLAEEASESDDPSKLRNVLRRSLSLNISPTALEKMDRVPDMGDEADVPIIIPPPNSIVRRSNRTTKLRKPSLGGEGDVPRGFARRRGTARVGQTSVDHGDQSESIAHRRVQVLSGGDKEQRVSQDSFDAGAIFDAYVRDDDEESAQAHSPPPAIPHSSSPPSIPITSLPETEPSPSLLDALGPILRTTEPEPESQLSESAPQEYPPPARTPSPTFSQETSHSSGIPHESTSPPSQPAIHTPEPQHLSIDQKPSFLDTPPTPQQLPPTRKEKKSQKSGLFKWGSDKSSKKKEKESKEKEKDKDRTHIAEAKEKESKEKEPGFFGSLFSKKNKDSSSSSSHGHESSSSQGHGKDGAALLGGGANKANKQQPPSPATPGFGMPAPGGGIINNYSRYPLHVERAIYRLSHIKLANPRRPLYEQVLISNLMFWYLGVINRAQGQQQQQAQEQQQQQAQMAAGQADSVQEGGGPNDAGVEVQENERETMEAQQKSLDQERTSMESDQRQQQQVQPQTDTRHNGNYNNTNNNTSKRESSPKRGPLTKAAPAGQGGRRGEMMVKGPQYDMQHRAMEQEYSYGAGGGGRSPSSAPPQWGGGYQSQPQQQYGGLPSNQPPRLVTPQQQPTEENPFYYSVDMVQQPQPKSPTQRLPPGAMAPADRDAWEFGQRPNSKTPPPRESSPSQGAGSGARSLPSSQQGLLFPSLSQDSHVDGKPSTQQKPSRSVSATVVSAAPANGKIRKGVSAHAAVPSAQSYRGRPRTTSEGKGYANKEKLSVDGEEEDVPLAVYQQNRRR